MGRKRTRKGKYFYFCIVSILTGLLIISCSSLKSRQYILKSESLLLRGEFEAALEENQKILSIYSDKPPADKALYNMGLIYAHYANPQKDYKKASEFFWELIKNFPKSSKAEEAKIWIGVLNKIEGDDLKIQEAVTKEEIAETEDTARKEGLTKKEEIERQKISKNIILAEKLMARGEYERALEENKKVLSIYSNKSPGDGALYNIGLIYAHLKDYKKAKDSFKRLLNEFPNSSYVKEAKIWIGIIDVIEETKRIDLEIEQKKRELAK